MGDWGGGLVGSLSEWIKYIKLIGASEQSEQAQTAMYFNQWQNLAIGLQGFVIVLKPSLPTSFPFYFFVFSIGGALREDWRNCIAAVIGSTDPFAFRFPYQK